MKAPFPWFGGKARCASQVWQALGAVGNYVEPFAGSLAVLLARPSAPDCETVNDADCNIANFWRALQSSPDEVARYADWPVNEADLHARHAWLVTRRAELRERVVSDPDYFDAKIAGWWVWGVSSSIGNNWQRDRARSIPHLADFGRGVHSLRVANESVLACMSNLSARLRRVRVACGDWNRVLTKSVVFSPIATRRSGDAAISAVFLDPPYADGDQSVYGDTEVGISTRVREWAIEHGDNPLLRIVLCGYDGEHAMPPSWRVVERAEKGGYGNASKTSENVNRTRERLWLSPHCLTGNNGVRQ